MLGSNSLIKKSPRSDVRRMGSKSGAEVHKPNDFLVLFVGVVKKLQPYVIGIGIADPYRNISSHASFTEANHSGDTSFERLIQLKPDPFGADFSTAPDVNGVINGQSDWKFN